MRHSFRSREAVLIVEQKGVAPTQVVVEFAYYSPAQDRWQLTNDGIHTKPRSRAPIAAANQFDCRERARSRNNMILTDSVPSFIRAGPRELKAVEQSVAESGGPSSAPGEPILAPGEAVVAAFNPDLDDRQRFSSSAVLLTNQRVLARKTPSNNSPEPPSHSADAWQAWPLEIIASATSFDRGGLGRIELHSKTDVLVRFRFTLREAGRARRFLHSLQEILDGSPTEPSAAEPVCEKCGGLLPAEGVSCPTCEAKGGIPKSARSLLRLERFARNGAGMIVLGFFLTLASTAAGLVSAYITMPLIDKVLFPMQTGKQVPFSYVYGYIVALAGAAILAWLLGWARSYVMAWVSERDSAPTSAPAPSRTSNGSRSNTSAANEQET